MHTGRSMASLFNSQALGARGPSIVRRELFYDHASVYVSSCAQRECRKLGNATMPRNLNFSITPVHLPKVLSYQKKAKCKEITNDREGLEIPA
jgi:hypothetical protein